MSGLQENQYVQYIYTEIWNGGVANLASYALSDAYSQNIPVFLCLLSVRVLGPAYMKNRKINFCFNLFLGNWMHLFVVTGEVAIFCKIFILFHDSGYNSSRKT